jgi:hypothetical protein
MYCGERNGETYFKGGLTTVIRIKKADIIVNARCRIWKIDGLWNAIYFSQGDADTCQ